MSEQAAARKRSRRSPAASGETVAPLEPAEDVVPSVTESPVDPKSTTSYRLTLAAVIILGVLILIGVGVLAVGLVKGWGHTASQPAAAHPAVPAKPPRPVTMSLAPGFHILSSDSQPGRLILHVRSDTLDEYDIIDLNDGRIIAQIHAEAPK